ncbi:Glycosyltransferase, catalytic subunit of cellulose synthase and poly-beta-1,6-N-acetylglucosamine synthase [Salegentibacter echinorum]|uniref:Glycosyltransferase, catalytic subunit of cellulose synthase and poly-beta-1,6-N-acetylglucosamine synthase n=1 Tax=Salegentibacter echinorum TaxID=1073325 RepID=A0A1M5JTW4_SALEC|nr:glycosyltransferase [Salegentibacter echinorum]SHG43720.1 Glycosyltransferase, catalytic subunit of cellulose synthase and poly-beta-1,6-N-acetylglucosamine synthase [Salegentibacter echinorum]
MLIFYLICTLYAVLILSLIYGWKRIPYFSSEGLPSQHYFSIIIPFRNEAENLPDLLKSIAEINYPASKFEILMINDASEDTGVAIIKNFQQKYPEIQLKIIANKRFTNSPKKDAIHTAINEAKFDYTLTTDADCQLPIKWLQVYNDFLIRTESTLVAGQVALRPTQKLSQIFEEIDVFSLQATTGGAFGIKKSFFCSAANLCYKKQAFFEVSGYEGNTEIASGDDVFLLQKFQQKNYKISFLKNNESIVYTKAQKSFKNLISQRLRWASKTPSYTSLFAKFAGIVVLLMNFSLLVTVILSLFQMINFGIILLVFIVKICLDFTLIYQSAVTFNRKKALIHYWWSSIFYPFFSSFVAIKTLFSSYSWKGRTFNPHNSRD